MNFLPIADLTAAVTLTLAGITLALALAIVALAVVIRHGTVQARLDARAELKVLERQISSGHRPLLVDVITTAPVPPDMGALYDVTRSEDPDRTAEHPGPLIETRFPGHSPALFDPRTVFVSSQAGKLYVSVPVRNVGRGLAVIASAGVELRGPLVGALEHRSIQRSHVPVGETTRVELVAGYLQQEALAVEGQAMRGIAWELTVPYCDFAGEQRTLARVEIVCRGEDIGGPWLVERVQQESPGDQELRRDEPTGDSSSPRTTAGRRQIGWSEPVVDMWGNPIGQKRRSD